MAVLVHARRKRLLLSGEIRLLSGIHMYKGMPALLSRQVKVTTLGYDWRKIQRKKLSGLKRIFIHRQPNSRRYKNKCKNCRDQVASKCDYCCPSCKIVHKPTGNNADLLQDLINIDFNEEAVRDFFCLGCLRAFASTHCANHNLHIHGDEEDAVLVEIREHHGWQLIPEDVIGQPVLLERIKRILVDGVPMVAVCRRQVPDYRGANRCANLSCRESVDQAGDICCIECLFSINLLANNEDEDEDEEPLSPPQDLDSDSDED